MRQIETDYLVVGAGASGMAFVDSLVSHSDADIVMVDRQHRPGGHWLGAYPFVRLHQPSANYGVTSRVLGNDRIDETGPNAGFYERSTAAEICDYFNRVLEEQFLPSGRVRFYGMCDYRGVGPDGHLFVSNVSGEPTTVKVRRKLVDATYLESSIPSTHTPAFEADAGVVVVPPNDLVKLREPASGYTVLGAGKTAMDTCNWLLDEGVDPDRIRWIKPRDGWAMNRAAWQPLELVGAYMQFQADFVQAAAENETASGFVHQLGEQGDTFLRVDTDVDPEVFRGAILSTTELGSLRRITNVVRQGRVLRISTDRIILDGGEIPNDHGQIHVDCTAEGVRTTEPRPIFESDRITIQLVTLGIIPWSAATVGFVEASREDEVEKNRLCQPAPFNGHVSDILRLLHGAMNGLIARLGEPDIAAWNEACRLNPARGAADHMDDPRVPAAMATLGANLGPAMSNLERLATVAAF